MLLGRLSLLLSLPSEWTLWLPRDSQYQGSQYHSLCMIIIQSSLLYVCSCRRVWECWLEGGLSLNGHPVKKHSSQVTSPHTHPLTHTPRLHVGGCWGHYWIDTRRAGSWTSGCHGDRRSDKERRISFEHCQIQTFEQNNTITAQS